nr:F-box domain-containing protein [Tanacetum cinerariifolium]
MWENSMFADLIEPADPDEDIAQDYLREEQLRLCLEGKEKMRCEHQKLIVKENRIRLDEAKRLRLEEENMLQLKQQKKNKRKEFMNSNHCKNLLSKLAPVKRIQLCSSSKKIQPKLVRDTYVSCQHLMVRCEERHEQILKLQNLVGSTIVVESVRLLQKFQQDDLESYRGMMRLICETQLKVQLLVVLERANIFQNNGIDPSKYTITFRLDDNVPKQEGVFGNYDAWVCILLYRLAHGLSLDVDDPVDFP